MGFMVVPKGESNGWELQAHGRLLRRKGVDLGNLPRAWAPGGGRWLPVWNTEPEASAFVEELKQYSKDPNWTVLVVEAPVSPGPLGPIEIQMGRLSDSWNFGLHPLSRALLQSACPGAY